jgi:hypothetical protein
MPTITINGVRCDFTKGERILDIANRNGVEIPQYCYHDGLSSSPRAASAWRGLGAQPQDQQARAFMGGKLLPTCQTPAVRRHGRLHRLPKAVANQKAVMEYLLINHPLDCPVCDQSGECFLQDYSYQYGRGVSRFEEQKVKQPKKDVGPHVLYSDRCIMCTRCVRFTREVTGTGELWSPAAATRKRSTSSPASRSTTTLRQRHRPLPRRRAARQGLPLRPARLVPQGNPVASTASPPAATTSSSSTTRARSTASSRAPTRSTSGGSPTRSATAGSSCTRAEKAPNARGIRRVLESFGRWSDFDTLVDQCRAGQVGSLLLTGNYPSEWLGQPTLSALRNARVVLIDTHSGFGESIAQVVLPGATFAEKAGTWENCNGLLQSFEQAIPTQHQAKSEAQIALDLLAIVHGEKLREHTPGFGATIVDEQPGQVPAATDAVSMPRGPLFDPPATRVEMAASGQAMSAFTTDIRSAADAARVEPDMVMVEL